MQYTALTCLPRPTCTHWQQPCTRRVLCDLVVSSDKEAVLQDASRADDLSEGSDDVSRLGIRNMSATQHLNETNMMLDG